MFSPAIHNSSRYDARCGSRSGFEPASLDRVMCHPHADISNSCIMVRSEPRVATVPVSPLAPKKHKIGD